MFTPQGPTLRELAVQAFSSIEHGYDLLAPKFDHTPFRTPDHLLDAVVRTVRPLGPFATGLDICCGTGAGVGVLRRLCDERVTGVDFSAGMLAAAASAPASASAAASAPASAPASRSGSAASPASRSASAPASAEFTSAAVDWVRADARALPFAPAFDLAVSFGAFGHFLPAERPVLFAQAHAVLRPGGLFVFPLPAPPHVGSPLYWALWGFDSAMRLRNLLWHPRFVMYYRTFRLPEVLDELARTGFATELLPLTDLGQRPDGSPRCALVVALRE
ncbi:class I SAM-dependent methyltransferase [Streptomyces scopuliridis]|uniref:SAM-dependent methyltransferase n=1 Tax=Streptomyces scopuliridis RB72 TaxID=1440053 RepID=A0A2T7TEB8_9ACTN|nr:class I SAM-dependent methyltransferase [Streptomyces scopuliridis]PVE13431.1 SAM-dependent methyltransferase [Streptomyces scopuliridis RB72]